MAEQEKHVNHTVDMMKETTRFIYDVFNSSLIGSFKGYRCERCDAKYGSAVNFKYCPFCKREITEYVYREVQ